MVFVPAPQVAQAVVKHIYAGQEVNNVLAFGIAAVPNIVQLQTLASALQEAWVGAIMPLLSNQLTFSEVVVRDLTVADGTQVASAPAALVTGGVGGDGYPGSVALCMTHRTALIGRSRRGRTYFGGIPENTATVNTFQPFFLLAMKTAWDSVIADVEVSGWFFGILSRRTNKLPRPVGVFTAVTSSLFRDPRVDSQRGRLP